MACPDAPRSWSQHSVLGPGLTARREATSLREECKLGAPRCRKQGNVHLKWAFSETAVLLPARQPASPEAPAAPHPPLRQGQRVPGALSLLIARSHDAAPRASPTPTDPSRSTNRKGRADGTEELLGRRENRSRPRAARRTSSPDRCWVQRRTSCARDRSRSQSSATGGMEQELASETARLRGHLSLDSRGPDRG